MNALRYAHVMSRLIDAPLWAHPVKAAIVYNALAGRLGVTPIPLPDDPLLPALSAPRRPRPEASQLSANGRPARSRRAGAADRSSRSSSPARASA